MHPTLDHDFQFEFEQVQTRRLRRRLIWYACLNIALGLLGLIVTIALRFADPEDRPSVAHTAISLAGNVLALGPFVWCLIDIWKRQPSRPRMLRIIYWVIVASALVATLHSFLTSFLLKGDVNIDLFAAKLLYFIFTSHFIACLFLPWTPRESLRPMYPVVAVAVGCISALAIMSPQWQVINIIKLVMFAAACGAVLLPGLIVATWKHDSFARDFMVRSLGSRYGEYRRELTGAQRIHESLFPRPGVRGSLRLDFRYRPMRSIGGDYLYARFIPPLPVESAQSVAAPGEHDDLFVLLLDVTGHGIPAALTVNRLYGELERLIAENPQSTPTDVLRALNRYAFLTLSDHSLFITAIALRVQPDAGRILYANAGHPPALVCTAGGTQRTLDPTAMVLGVARDLDVEVDAPAIPFGPGDRLIAYTDGATESRNAGGRMFNAAGIADAFTRATAESAPRSQPLCADIMAAVDEHRHGPPTDDTLIVEITRLSSPASPTTTQFATAAISAPSRDGAREPVREPARVSAT